MTKQVDLPDETTAVKIHQSYISDLIGSVTRFPTGLCHYVYEVCTSSGRAYVVRIATPATRPYLEGGLYWHPRLKALGVPVPELFASSLDDPYPFMLLERLPGTDLGQVYKEMSASARQDLAGCIVDIQRSVGTLPMARRFGFAYSYEQADSSGMASWLEVVNANIARSEERIRRIGKFAPSYAERVRIRVASHDSYLRQVSPVPFLDDTTTKNVIINGCTLSGVVDTDQVCFGDPLFTVGLTNMALLSLGEDTDYIEYWMDAIDADQEQRRIVALYSLVFCLGFMSELGQMFNQRVDYDEKRAEVLRGIFERLVNTLAKTTQ